MWVAYGQTGHRIRNPSKYHCLIDDFPARAFHRHIAAPERGPAHGCLQPGPFLVQVVDCSLAAAGIYGEVLLLHISRVLQVLCKYPDPVAAFLRNAAVRIPHHHGNPVLTDYRPFQHAVRPNAKIPVAHQLYIGRVQFHLILIRVINQIVVAQSMIFLHY